MEPKAPEMNLSAQSGGAATGRASGPELRLL